MGVQSFRRLPGVKMLGLFFPPEVFMKTIDYGKSGNYINFPPKAPKNHENHILPHISPPLAC